MAASTYQLKISYFDVLGGRGGIVRAVLVYGDVPFEDDRVSFQQFGEAKAAGKATSLPILYVGKPGEDPATMKKHTQSLAMMRFAAKLVPATNLYPEEPEAALSVDEVLDTSQDILTKCPNDPDEAVKKQKREEYAAGKLKELFQVLEDKISQNGGEFFVGSAATIADISVYFLTGMIKAGFFDYVPATYLDQFPTIAAFSERFASHEIITKYQAYWDSTHSS